MKINHYALFEEFASNQIDWNYLRESNIEAPYFIPYDKELYIKLISNLDFDYYVDTLKKYCKQYNISKIISIGTGRCSLEYHLKMNTDLNIVVTDITDSILRIKSFGIFDDALQINLFENSSILSIDSNTLILLSRIDTEFDDNNFRKLFEILSVNNVKYVSLIPAELLCLRIIFAELKIFFISILMNKKRVNCGFARSKSEFIKAWKMCYSENAIFSNNRMFQLFKK